MTKEVINKDKQFIFRYLNFNDIDVNYFKLLNQLTDVDFDNITEDKNMAFFKKLNDSHMIIVIEHENEIIGSGTILIEEKLIRSYGRVSHIEDIVIDNEYRNYGLGKELLNTLIDISKDKGCYKCILDCKDELEDFYKKCNFKRKGSQMCLYF